METSNAAAQKSRGLCNLHDRSFVSILLPGILRPFETNDAHKGLHMQCNQYLLSHPCRPVAGRTLEYHFCCDHLVSHELSSETLPSTYHFSVVEICVGIMVGCMPHLASLARHQFRSALSALSLKNLRRKLVYPW